MKYYLEKEFKLLKKCRSRAERKAKITGKGQIYFVNLFAKEANTLPMM